MNKEILTGRAACYEYLSLVFRQPPNEQFLGLSEKFAQHFVNIGNAFGNDKLSAGAANLAEYARAESLADAPALLTKLNVIYTGLFNIGAESIFSNCSSALSHDRCVRQEPWENVMDAFRIRKFTVPSDFKDPEDHISMLFLFISEMSALAGTLLEQKKYDLLRIALEEQNNFMSKFIYTWVPQTCLMIEKRAKRDNPAENLYSAAAAVTSGFLETDKLIMGEIIESISPKK